MALKQIASAQSEEHIVVKLGSGLELSLYEIAFCAKVTLQHTCSTHF